MTVLAADQFARSASNGWGTADTGGAWSVTGATSRYAVGSGRASATLAAGVSVIPTLPAVSEVDLDLVADFALSLTPSGNWQQFGFLARRQGTSDYRCKAKCASSGVITLIVSKVVSNSETTLASVTIDGLTYTAGDWLTVHFSVVGSGTTALTAAVWPAGSTEPSPQITTTDTEAGLQTAGAPGIYLGESGASSAQTFLVDNLTVTDGAVAYTGAAALSVAAARSAAGRVGVSHGASLAVAASLTAAGTAAVTGGAALPVAVNVGASGSAHFERGAAQPVAAAVSAAGLVAAVGGASLPVQASAVAAGVAAGAAGASLAVAAAVTAAGAVGSPTGGTLPVSVSLSAAGVVGIAAAAALAATVDVDGSGEVAASAGAAAAVAAVLTASGGVGTTRDSTLMVAVVIAAAGRVFGAASDTQLAVSLAPRNRTAVVAGRNRGVTLANRPTRIVTLEDQP